MASAPPLVGIVGKLPAHGDFVRRGGPAEVLALVDRWLDAELGKVVGEGMALEEAVDALDGWRFRFVAPGATALASLIASGDRVGRRFPLVATITGSDGAEDWCAAAATALAGVRNAGDNADAALAALAAIPVPDEGNTDTPGWWRASGEVTPAGPDGALPTGDAFAALLTETAP